MSEIKAQVFYSSVGWKGVKEGDLLKVVKVEVGDRGIFLTLDDAPDETSGPPTGSPDDLPF